MLRNYITDRKSCPDVLSCIRRAAALGVEYIQIREKDLSGRELLELTRAAVAVAPGGGDVAYCQQRYKSYDPASGTYLGYDGQRHPCP